MLKRKGFNVRGSDQDVYPPMSDFLHAEGIPALAGYRPEHISADLDLVVVGNAISRGNPELEEVLDRKIRYCSLPEAIREHFLWGARSIVVAGTHGKTTTTAMIGWLLTHGGVDPSVLVGGIVRNFGEQGSSYRLGLGRDFVIEGDEYDSAFFDKTAKFLKYLPDIAIVNNVEFDHADIYRIWRLPLARRLINLVPGVDSCWSGPTALRARAGDAAKSRWRRSAPRTRRRHSTGRRTISSPLATTRFKVRRHGSPSAASRCPWSARTTCATRWPRSPSRPKPASASIASRKGFARLPASNAGSKSSVGRRRHGTTISRTIRRQWRNAGGAPRRQSEGAHLGGVRAALRFFVPAGVPGRFRARLRGR
jgi:UDP-N-acetylmuramate: L-alanyl-gamma-D-glutamyl-meso-diaminopimelate ligase